MDERHRQLILEYFGFNDKTNCLTGNGNVEICEEDQAKEKLIDHEITMFRVIAAKMNFLAQDCSDLQLPAKEICREISGSTQRSWEKTKKLARYLVRR